MGFATIRQPVSLRRVTLLLVLGALVGLNFTRPGVGCLASAARALDGRRSWPVPAWVRQQPRDWREWVRWQGVLWKAFHGEDIDGAAWVKVLEPPLADRVEVRLGAVGGWETAALYRDDASPNDLLEAGLVDRVGCLRVMRPSGYTFQIRPFGPSLVARWYLVLLDGQGAELGRTMLTERIPGRELERFEDDMAIDRHPADRVDVGDAPKAVFFRRGPEGVIRGA